MDWYFTTTGERPAPGATAVAATPGGPGHERSGAQVDPGRLDVAFAQGVERQAELVLAGVQVAALYGGDGLNAGAVLPGGSPAWLSADVDLLVQLVRLSAAAGVVLAHGVAGAPTVDLLEPAGHLTAVRDGYRALIDVLGRMSVADEVQATCRDDALRLLRQVERRVHHLDHEHPGATVAPPPRVFDHEYIPGELLG